MKSYSIQSWLSLIFLIGISYAASGQCSGIALLDSSFESGIFDIDGHNGWFRSDGGSFEQGGYHGTLSACSNAGGLWQIVPVQAQTTYYLSCYVKNRWADSYKIYAGATEFIDSTVASDWTFISMPFTTGQDTSISLGYFTAGSVCFDFMRLTCDPISGLEPRFSKIEFSIFPNPTSGRISLRFDKPLSEGRATLTNSLGQVVRSQGIRYASELVWDVSEMPVGVYFVQVWRDGQAVVRRVVRI